MVNNWIIRVYNEDELVDSWVLQNRTENEAESEALADVTSMQGSFSQELTFTIMKK